jgi:methionine-rich copper-binding protein CopC
MILRPLLALAVGATSLLATSPALAHAKLVSASPAENAAGPAPRQIVLQFNEKLLAKFSGFELLRGGAPVPVKVSVGKDRLSLVGVPAKPLAAGAYEVKWHAATPDAHKMQGAYSFTVR